MNTTTRTVMAAATGAALLLGAAGSALATPAHHPSKARARAGFVQLRQVGIHSHSAINVNADATTRDLGLRAKVWDTSAAGDATVTITLAQYDRRRGSQVEPGLVADLPVELAARAGRSRKVRVYSGALTGAALLRALAEGGVGVAPGSTMLLCIATAEATAPDGVTVRADAQQVRTKEAGRDCVKVINVDPATTRTGSDDPVAP